LRAKAATRLSKGKAGYTNNKRKKKIDLLIKHKMRKHRDAREIDEKTVSGYIT
jgi:hypothetical protein